MVVETKEIWKQWQGLAPLALAQHAASLLPGPFVQSPPASTGAWDVLFLVQDFSFVLAELCQVPVSPFLQLFELL